MPAAACTFCPRMAFLTSSIEMSRPARRSGSSQRRIAYVRPDVATWPTPSTRAIESAICFSTKLESSCTSISRPSVMKQYMTMRSSGLFRTVMPFCVTSVGSRGSARLTAF